jgi:hypothetical protein
LSSVLPFSSQFALALDARMEDFSDISFLTLSGSTEPINTANGTILRLTPAANSQAGSVFSSFKVNTDRFSTHFTFRISNPNNGGADGLVFVVQSVSSSIGGHGGGMGYSGIPNSVGVEFDIWHNSGKNDPSGNHVGINTYGSFNGPVANLSTSLENGIIWHVWIDYDGNQLQVRANQTGKRPVNPLLSHSLNLTAILGGIPKAFIGFTAGTGAANANHDILSWAYRDWLNPFGDSGEVDAKTDSQPQLACDNLPGEVESLQILPDNLLLLGLHNHNRLQVFEIDTCELIDFLYIPTDDMNDIEGLAVPIKNCPLMEVMEQAIALAKELALQNQESCLTLDNLKKGDVVEGLGVAHPDLNISTSGEAIVLEEGKEPALYISNHNEVFNGCISRISKGFGDKHRYHDYTFTVVPEKTFSNLSLRLLDFGDLNKAKASEHVVSLVGYDANGHIVSTDIFSYTSKGKKLYQENVLLGNRLKIGDACSAQPGDVGNRPYAVAGSDMVLVRLEYYNNKTGNKPSDPNFAVGDLCFTTAPATNGGLPPGLDEWFPNGIPLPKELPTLPIEKSEAVLDNTLISNKRVLNDFKSALVTDGLKTPVAKVEMDRVAILVDNNEVLYTRFDVASILVEDDTPLGLSTVTSEEGIESRVFVFEDDNGQRHQQLLLAMPFDAELLRQTLQAIGISNFVIHKDGRISLTSCLYLRG